MEFHLARFMSYREDFDDYTPDETQTLIKYLLTEAFFPRLRFRFTLQRSCAAAKRTRPLG